MSGHLRSKSSKLRGPKSSVRGLKSNGRKPRDYRKPHKSVAAADGTDIKQERAGLEPPSASDAAFLVGDGSSPPLEETVNVDILASSESGSEQSNLTDPDPVPSNGRQSGLMQRLRDVCKEFDLPIDRARDMARAGLGDDYTPEFTLPDHAENPWKERDQQDKSMTPIEFIRIYWQHYISDGVMSQDDLKRLDLPLYKAIIYHCGVSNLDAKRYLPPPSRSRAKRPQTGSMEPQPNKGDANPTAPSRSASGNSFDRAALPDLSLV
jgi:hypothetical protein